MRTARPVGTIALVLAAGLVMSPLHVFAGPASTVRPAYCAGGWYPADATRLAQQIKDLLARASPATISEKPVAIISPHAGYRFSAAVAAAGYRKLEHHAYRRVVVLAFSHASAGRYSGVDVPGTLTAYRTPLGDVPIDREVCDALLKSAAFSSHADVDRGEHSLELQLPFLQSVLGEFRLVPLLVGRMSSDDYVRAAKAVLPWLDDGTLLVASSDFTHYGPRYGYVPFREDVATRLRALADEAARSILQCDFDGFQEHLAESGDTICGRGPIALLLRILSMQGSAVGRRAAIDTSGRMTNDWTNSVTYQSIVFTRRPAKLGPRARDQLLKLARRTVQATLEGQAPPRGDISALPEALRADGACFVTLENHGRLRGCIGNLVANGPLYESVIHNAVSACHDRRFVDHPVTASELDELEIEISYLTPMKRVARVEEVIIGRHGLLISWGRRRGVLLPQVAARRGWSRKEFLAQTCRKAGLPLDAWKRPEAELYSFEAEVFGESKPTEPHRSGHH